MSFGPWLHAGSSAAFVRPWCQGQALQGCAAGRAARGAPRCIPALATAAGCSCLPPLPSPYGHRATELCFLLFLRFRLLRIKAPHPGLVSWARSWSEDGRRGLGKPILSLAASPRPALLWEGNPPGTRHGPALPQHHPGAACPLAKTCSAPTIPSPAAGRDALFPWLLPALPWCSSCCWSPSAAVLTAAWANPSLSALWHCAAPK